MAVRLLWLLAHSLLQSEQLREAKARPATDHQSSGNLGDHVFLVL